MQMGDSEDRGGLTAQFGAAGPGHSSILSNRDADC